MTATIALTDTLKITIECLKRIEEVELHENLLNNWERMFINGIAKQLSKGTKLTYNQVETLRKLHAKVTDPKFTD